MRMSGPVVRGIFCGKAAEKMMDFQVSGPVSRTEKPLVIKTEMLYNKACQNQEIWRKLC